MLTLFENQTAEKNTDKSIPVFNIDKKEFEIMQVSNLFKEFEVLKCITFSSSIKQMINLLINYSFKEVELIIGLSEDYRELTALEDLSESVELLIKDVNVSIYKAKNTHTKLYLLSDSGRFRVVTGSANLSQTAWSGKQNEIFLYSDDYEVFSQFASLYEDVKAKSVCLLTDRELKQVRNELKNRLKVSVKIDRIENLPIEKLDDKTLKVLMESTRQIENITISNLLVNVNVSKPKLQENFNQIEKDRKFWEKIQLLSDHRKSIILKGAEAIPEIINQKKEENELIDQSFVPYRIYYASGKFTINRVSEIGQIDHSSVHREIKSLSNVLNAVGEYNPEIPPYVMEAIMFSFAGSYIWYLRKYSGIEKENLPIFGFLAGMSTAGKSLTLRLIKKMTRAIFYEDKDIKDRGKIVDAYFGSEDSIFGVNPFIMDEIKLDAIRNQSSALHTRVKSMTNQFDGRGHGVFIGAFNLEYGNLQLELIRRVFFVPFKKPLPKELRRKIIKDVNKLDWFTYLYFLSTLQMDRILDDGEVAEDILYPVRSFFKNLSNRFQVKLPVSDHYLGSYEKFMINEWKLYYLTHRDAFVPFDYRGIPAFKVKKEKFLVALHHFVINSSGQYFVINRNKFLETIGEKQGKSSFIRLFSLFKSR